MVGSISSVSLVSSSGSASARTSGTDLAAQLAAKQQELTAAKTADERKTIQVDIDALKARIDAQSSGSSGQSSGARPIGPPPGGPPPQQGNTANVGSKNFDSKTPFGNRQMYV